MRIRYIHTCQANTVRLKPGWDSRGWRRQQGLNRVHQIIPYSVRSIFLLRPLNHSIMSTKKRAWVKRLRLAIKVLHYIPDHPDDILVSGNGIVVVTVVTLTASSSHQRRCPTQTARSSANPYCLWRRLHKRFWCLLQDLKCMLIVLVHAPSEQNCLLLTAILMVLYFCWKYALWMEHVRT